MARGGGGGAPRATDSAAVVPMEDTIDALMDYLVAPLLPLRVSSHEAPTDDRQEAVARQVDLSGNFLIGSLDSKCLWLGVKLKRASFLS